MKWLSWFYSYLRRGAVYFWNGTSAAVWANVANMIILDVTDVLDFCFASQYYTFMLICYLIYILLISVIMWVCSELCIYKNINCCKTNTSVLLTVLSETWLLCFPGHHWLTERGQRSAGNQYTLTLSFLWGEIMISYHIPPHTLKFCPVSDLFHD